MRYLPLSQRQCLFDDEVRRLNVNLNESNVLIIYSREYYAVFKNILILRASLSVKLNILQNSAPVYRSFFQLMACILVPFDPNLINFCMKIIGKSSLAWPRRSNVSVCRMPDMRCIDRVRAQMDSVIPPKDAVGFEYIANKSNIGIKCDKCMPGCVEVVNHLIAF